MTGRCGTIRLRCNFLYVIIKTPGILHHHHHHLVIAHYRARLISPRSPKLYLIINKAGQRSPCLLAGSHSKMSWWTQNQNKELRDSLSSLSPNLELEIIIPAKFQLMMVTTGRVLVSRPRLELFNFSEFDCWFLLEEFVLWFWVERCDPRCYKSLVSSTATWLLTAARWITWEITSQCRHNQ